MVGEDIRAEILKTGIRKLERGTGVRHHTLERILRGEPVRRKTLAKAVKHLGVVASSAILPREMQGDCWAIAVESLSYPCPKVLGT